MYCFRSAASHSSKFTWLLEDNLKHSLVHFHVKSGSIIVMWHVPKRLSDTLEQLIYKKAAMLREKGVEEVTIGGKIVYHSTEKV